MASKIAIMLIIILVVGIFGCNFISAEEVDEMVEKADEIGTINTGIDPLLVIEDIEVDDQIAVGKEFQIKLVVRNIGTGSAMNPKIHFEEQDENGKLRNFEVVNSADGALDYFDPKTTEIKSRETRTFTVKIKVRETAPEREAGYVLNIKLECQNAHQGNDRFFATNTNIRISPKYVLTKPFFLVRTINFNPKEPDLTEPFKVDIFFENISDTNANNVSVAIEGFGSGEKRNFQILDLTNTKQLFNIRGKQTRMVTYELEAEDNRESNEIKIRFYYDHQGETETQEEIINLPLSREDLRTTGKIPWVIINRYTLSANQILAGNTVSLKLDIENTSEKDIHNAKISIVDIQLEDNKVGDTVFSPVNSSNTFFIEKISGRSTQSHEVSLYVDPNAQAKTYNVPIEMVYEYDNGQQNTVNERINIPVTQESRFEILSVDIPPMASLGQPVPIAAEFVNVGKVALSNFRVTMEGDFIKENATYYVGNFEMGMSDYYQAMIIPQEEGELEGTIVFSYMDNNNQEVKERQPFMLNVAGMQEPPPGMEVGPDGKPLGFDQGMPGGTGVVSKLTSNWLPILVGLLVVGQGIFIWRLKRKMNQNGEFFDV